MPLVNDLSVDVRPEKQRQYLELCNELAERAGKAHESFTWSAFSTQIGQASRMHFVTTAADFAELASRGTPEEMFVRVLGESRAVDWLAEASVCATGQQTEVSVDRPELSYTPSEAEGPPAAAIVTVAQARPGQQESCEELIRKIAEAIPKVNASGRLVTYETVIGQLGRYWTVRPIESLAELDEQLPAPQLLSQAFGAAEGGLIFRSGAEAIERVERSVVVLRPELSNAG